MSEGAQRSCGVTPKKTWPINNTRDLIIRKVQVDIGGLSNSLSHLVKHQRLVFTLGIAGVRESVGTRVVSMRSLISCMTRNIPYRIALFIWNVIGRFHGYYVCILSEE